ADAAALRAAIKGWMTRDRTGGPDYLAQAAAQGASGFTLYERALLQAIANDPAVTAAPEPQGARIYAAMDRAVLRGPGFAAVLSLTSPRTTAFEFGNGENLKGWWTGAGMLALYDADQAQFGAEFWATVDSRRLPGTTTDGSGQGRPLEWKQFPNPEAWVGGASLGSYAAIGMAFSMREITGSQLAGRKSWFFLNDRILALGSGIEGGQGAAETVVENRRLADPRGARLLVDGQPLVNGAVERARWAHLADTRTGSRIGYVFPQGGPLLVRREERSGSWRDVNEHALSQETWRDSYQFLTIPHGAPSYAYLLLPGASEAATSAAATSHGLRIEANDARAAAVSLPAKGVYAANLWKAGSAPRAGKPYVSSSAPAAVVVERSAGRLRIAVAEPTQGEAAIELELAEAASRLLRASPGVTVMQTSPRLRLRIDTRGAAGSGFEAEFRAESRATPPKRREDSRQRVGGVVRTEQFFQ
uniref:polysaccharide lyase family 8 super-sandwich domain-containing protein n=1 Tax=uncultured Massilia sp. TaxID=169973 RepID=UPI002585888B